jgi:hypothetical protein
MVGGLKASVEQEIWLQSYCYSCEQRLPGLVRGAAHKSWWYVSILCKMHPEDGGDTILRNVGSYRSHTVSFPRR